jgi:hypothetical protein
MLTGWGKSLVPLLGLNHSTDPWLVKLIVGRRF